MFASNNQRGSALVIVLFIILVAALIVSTITAVILNSLRSTTSYSFSLRAHYAAESGVERGLYYLNAARRAKIYGLVETADAINGMTAIFANGATYTLVTELNDDILQAGISEGRTVQFDFFAEDYTTGFRLVPLTDLATIQINWNEDSSCSVSTMEVSFSSWTELLWEDISDLSSGQTRYVVDCPPGTSFDCEYSLGVDNSYLYRVRLKPIHCNAPEVEVTALDSVENTIVTYNFINITSQGQLSTAVQVVSADAVWHAALTDYFDYVLFSEYQITK